MTPPPSDPSPPDRSWEPPAPEELQRLLPQYEVLELIGRGGMGAVYRGRQARLEREVAVKLMPRQEVDEFHYADRFEREAKAMAGMDHPAIVSVYDFGQTEEGHLYFVMEFIDGMDIHRYLHHRGGRLPQDDALAIVSHVLDGLDYAHQRGIVHRDIKPANILLNHEGRVKIADFGLAKKLAGDGEATVHGLTRSNVTMGTPDFVAPETLEGGRAADHRADLYAVGVMLYQMLTGRMPRGHFRLPSQIHPELDPRLDEIVAKATATDPENRYESATAVRLALDEVLSGPLPAAVEAPPEEEDEGGKPRAGRKGRAAAWTVGAGAAAALAVGLLVLGMGGGKEEPSDESGMGILPMASTEQTSEPGPAPVAPAVETEDTPPPPAEPDPEPEAAPALAKAAPAEEPPAEASEAAPATVTEAPAPPTADSPLPTEEPPAADSPPPTESTSQEPSAENQELLAVPGVASRLDAYLDARGEQLDALAANYLRALGEQIDRAADVGDLPLVDAFQREKAAVEAFRESLAAPAVDPAAAALAATALPELGSDAPEGLVALRGTWRAERERIRADLDGKLAQSLAALETELTRAREFGPAREVHGFRETLSGAGSGAAGPSAPDMAEAEAEGAEPATARGSRPPDPELARASKDAPFENRLGMKFVPVPGTDVLFCIHETRYKDYEEFARRTRESIDGGWRNQTRDGVEIRRGSGDHPVTSVSWEDAQRFCAWLSEREGRTYRLPTDREWSIAVGIGDHETWEEGTTPATVFKPEDHFPWGTEWPPPAGAGNYSDESRRARVQRDDASYIEGYDDGFPTTAPVMSFAPNEYGLYDMGGNVWEWVEDWHDGTNEHRILRGSSFYGSGRSGLLSSFRYRVAPGLRGGGFRVVLDLRASTPDETTARPPAPAPPAAVSPPAAAEGQVTTNPVRATKDELFENSLGMRFVPVPGTDVLFCIHQTRWRDYAAYAEENPGISPNWRTQTHDGFVIEDRVEDHPVVRVTWEDAQAFCEWLSEKEGKPYRLPTDREWSIAVGIGRHERWRSNTTPETVAKPPSIFPWGTNWPPPPGAGNFSCESRNSQAP